MDLYGIAESFVDKRNVAESLMERLGDEQKVRGIFSEMEQESQARSEYLKLAIIAFQILKDRPMTNHLVQSALERSGDRYTLLTIAGFIARRLKEADWAVELYEKAIDLCSDRFQYEHVLSLIEIQASDKNILKNLHKRLRKRW